MFAHFHGPTAPAYDAPYAAPVAAPAAAPYNAPAPVPYAQPYSSPSNAAVNPYASPVPANASYVAAPVGGGYNAAPVAAPVAGPMMGNGPPVPWSTNLFDCFDDGESCCLGLFLPPCQDRMTYANLENRQPEFCDYAIGGCACLAFALYGLGFFITMGLACSTRLRLKRQYSVGTSKDLDVNDVFALCCCLPCSICQNTRETNLRWRGMSSRQVYRT